MSIQPIGASPQNNHSFAQENQPHPLTSIAQEALAAQTSNPIEQRQLLAEGLNQWKSDPNVRGNKKKAVSRILKAYDSKSTSLSLEDLQLTSLPPEIGRLSALTWLDLSSNRLRQLPPEIGRLSALTHLVLGCNKLRQLPPEIESLSALTAFDLSSNRLRQLPPEIGKLSALAHLALSCNKLRQLPPEIGRLSALTWLCLGCNKLQQLSPEIGALSKLAYLNLNHNRLQQLSPEIGRLSTLTQLCLGYNKLEQFPPEIASLSALTHLALSRNKLQQLSPEIGRLSALTWLDLDRNQLEQLPSEIGNLSTLGTLNLIRNNLRQLPLQIGRLIHLTHLYLYNNPNLRELPITLGEIPGLTDLDIEETAIPETVVESLLASCRSKRGQAAAQELPNRLNLWQGFAGNNDTLDFIHELTDQEKITINEWLVRLSKTRDFASNQTDLAKTVCAMLQDINTHEEFKTAFFNQVNANLEACEDRAAMAFNELFVSWKILTMDQNASLKDKLTLLKGAARTEALRKALASKVENQGESVEIYLYYKSSMRKALGLLTAIKGMYYSSIGKCDWINKQELFASVKSTYLEIMANYPQLEALAKQDLQQELGKIDTDIESKEPDKEKLSEGAYVEAYNNLKLEREQRIRELRIKWIKKKLSRRRREASPKAS